MERPLLDPLIHATVLVELGELAEAEQIVADTLDERPDDRTALSLFAKLKHVRGELSEAVACWAQLAQARPQRTASMHLAAMMELARDPVRGAGEFVAVGQFQLVRKPAAYLALEEAFRLFVARRPKEARAACRQVARRYHLRDREVYKLAVLAEAWLGELSGETEKACDVLERLAEERGFETDLDRVYALLTLYERLGTRARLTSALNICRFLARSGEPVHGRLTLLCQRLGQHDEARGRAAEHVRLFRQEMHRPSVPELLAVAGSRYLPLARLRAVRPPPVAAGEPPASPRNDRELGLEAALAGDYAAARASFEAGAERLDHKYLGDVAALEGREDEAVERYVAAARDDPADLRLAEALLDAPARCDREDVAALYREPAVYEPLSEVLEQALDADRRNAARWRMAAALYGLQSSMREPHRRYAQRADAMTQAARQREQAVGRVLAAAVFRFGGQARGLIHEIWAGREPAAPGMGGGLPDDLVFGNLTDEMRRSVRNTFMAIREYARARFPHLTRELLNFNYSYKVTKDDEPSGGTSAGLPTALAFLSVFLQRPVPQSLAATGVVVADAHDVLQIRAVGDPEPKVAGACHRNLARILVPAGNRPELEAGHEVPGAVRDDLVIYVTRLDEAVHLVFGDMERG